MSDIILKRGEVFCFLDGDLTVKIAGHGDANGWGTFRWDETQIKNVPHEENSGSSIEVDVPPTELIELRDFLCRIFPKPIETVTALRAIAEDNCGCSPVHQCESQSALKAWKEWAKEIARAAIAKAEGLR